MSRWKNSKKLITALLSASMFVLNVQPMLSGNGITKASAQTPEEEAAAIVANMTLEEKVGQMFMPDFRTWNGSDFTVYNDEVGNIIKQYHLGGVILFANNVKTTDASVRLMDGLQSAAPVMQNTGAKIPLITTIDQEGGSIVRLGQGTVMPGNMALGATNDPEEAYKVGKATGEELKAIGINVDFAPDLDCNINPFNPVIGVRSFGGDPNLVAKMGTAYINGLHDAGVGATGKHFPGHGDTSTDSHLGIPIVTHDLATVHNLDLVPFQTAINNGIDMIMTAHVVFPAVDNSTVISAKDGSTVSVPATLSHKVLTDLLRTEMGFKGVITTDAMNMGAITQNFGDVQASIMAIQAGTDILLMPAAVTKTSEIGNLDKVFKGVINAVNNGEISVSRINESAQRIIALKIKRGIYNPAGNTDNRTTDQKVSDALKVVGSAEHKAIETEASNKAVTLVKNDNNILPFNLKSNDTVVIFTPLSDRTTLLVNSMEEVFKARNLTGVTIKSFNYSSSTLSAAMKSAIDSANYVILGTYGYDKNSTTPGYNYYTLFPQNVIAYNLISKNAPLVALSMVNPYDIMSIPNVGAYVATYGRYANQPNLVSGIRAIFGLINPSGKLPTDIPDGVAGYNNKTYIYRTGFGLSYPMAINETLSNSSLERNQTANISLTAAYLNGIPIDLAKAAITYTSSNPEVASVEKGIVTAKNTGTADIYASVTIDGVTAQSNKVTVVVTTSFDSINSLMKDYITNGKLSGALVPQLSNSLEQAEKFYKENKLDQAKKHMGDFIKHLNNPPMSDNISKEAKDILNSDANALVKSW